MSCINSSMIQALLLTNGQIIISQAIPERDPDGDESYFNLMYPYVLTFESDKYTLTPWLSNVTESTENFIVYPDKIITVKEPNSDILNYYKKLVLFNDNKIIKPDSKVNVTEQEVTTPTESKIQPSLSEEEIDEVFNEGEEI